VRAYVANGGDSFAVLPGGLTRVAKNPDDLVVSMQSGGGSKDTWVLFNGATNRPEPAHAISEPRLAEQVLPGIPSRAADQLFWVGRYTERLEQLLRVLRCVLGRVSGEPGGEDSTERKGLAELTANLGFFPRPLAAAASSNELSKRMLQLLYELEEPGGVRKLLRNIRFIANAVRDRFSGDTWRILGRLDSDARARPGRLPLASATALIHNLVLDLAAFNGMEMENMTRGRGWRFLDFGRRLERGLSVVRLLQAAAKVKTQPAAVLEPVLEIADSVMTYRRLYFAAPQLPGVLALVIRDDSNPRSLAFQVNVLREHTAALVVDSKTATPAAEQVRIDSLAHTLHLVNLDELAAQYAQGTAQPLLDRLSAWATDLAALSDQVTNRYFSHNVPRLS
ncbi:MAG: circularly permuted type 2 ATP-grasp protein, partial [Verrucomicrobiota bacterium]